LGRAGSEPGIRELVIGGTPYVILYRLRGDRVIISTIWHTAQKKYTPSS
jgi:plasmid stabilization system protein ParE